MKFNKVRYLPTGKGRGAVKLLVLFSLQALLLWTQKLFFMAIYLLSQMRYIFAACHASYAQKRYNLPCGRLRYDINPLHAPQGISHRRYIARDSVYRKSRKGFISLRSVLKGTTHKVCFFVRPAGAAICLLTQARYVLAWLELDIWPAATRYVFATGKNE